MAFDSADADRPFDPSARRIRRAAQAGQLRPSQALNVATASVAVTGVLLATGAAWFGGLCAYIRKACVDAGSGHAFGQVVGQVVKEGGLAAVAALAWPLGTILIFTVLSQLAQTRGTLAWESLRLKADLFTPALRRVLGRESLGDVGNLVLSVALLLGVGITSLRDFPLIVAATMGAGPDRVLLVVGACLGRLAVRLCEGMIVLGSVDWLWQKYRRRRALRMTVDEMKREQKEEEGDPAMRAERLRLHREILDVSAADDPGSDSLLLVDTGFVAIKLGYREAERSAPVVAARWIGTRARWAQAHARVAGVPCFVEPALVRTLSRVALGDEIPAALFEPVARLVARTRAAKSIPTDATDPSSRPDLSEKRSR